MSKGKKKYNVLYLHKDFVIVDKSPGVLSVPERFTDEASVKKLLRDEYGEIYAVHRIDRFTSGVMIFARNEDAHKVLNQIFESRQVEKKYRALVQGRFLESSGTWRFPILKLPGLNKVVINKKGKDAVTHYKVLEAFESYSYLELKIDTGRTHQIRVHLQEAGHPLLVDPEYGNQTEFFVSEIKGNRKFNLGKYKEERPILIRTPLHSFSIQFKYPGMEEELYFEAPFPKDFKATLNQLRKWRKM